MADQIEMSSAELFGNSTQQPRNPFLLGASLNNNFVNTTRKPSVNTSWIPFNEVMSSYKNRYSTFAKWPKQMAQQPTMLVQAGFYYSGNGDYVTCFHCGISLKEWESQDDVVLEHKKWAPECKYLRMACDI